MADPLTYRDYQDYYTGQARREPIPRMWPILVMVLLALLARA